MSSWSFLSLPMLLSLLMLFLASSSSSLSLSVSLRCGHARSLPAVCVISRPHSMLSKPSSSLSPSPGTRAYASHCRSCLLVAAFNSTADCSAAASRHSRASHLAGSGSSHNTSRRSPVSGALQLQLQARARAIRRAPHFGLGCVRQPVRSLVLFARVRL